MTPTPRRERFLRFGALSFITLALLALFTLLATPATVPAAGDGARLRLAAAPGPEPGPVTISTVPPVPDFPVTIDGVTSRTDGGGQAHFASVVSGPDLDSRIAGDPVRLLYAGREVEVRPGRLSGPRTDLQLTLDVSYPVSFTFSGADERQIDTSSIKTLTVESATGRSQELPANEVSWLLGSQGIRNLRWSVQRVQYAGSNVVNASQQRFLPAEEPTVNVQLLFFAVDLQVRDAMFGFSHTGAVDLVYPDGHARRFPLDDGGRLSLPALPRGDYTLTIVASGPLMSRPLAISRDQELDLMFHSWLDVLVVLGAALMLAVGLLWRLLRNRRGGTRADAGIERMTHGQGLPPRAS